MTFPDLIRLAFASIPGPQDSLGRVLRLGLDRAQAWQALILTVVISTLLGELMSVLLPAEGAMVGAAIGTPLLAFFVQLCLLIVAIFAIFWLGRAMGGTGSFEGAIITVAWLQFVLGLLQIAQILMLLVAPPIAGWLGILGIGLFFWLITYFTAELHGFTQPGKVFLMVILALIGIAFGLSVILSMIGIAVPGA